MTIADTHEPDPVPNDRPAVWALVIADMQARDAEGRRKYGTPLQPFNGRDALVDAYQEGLDLVVYLRQVLEERTPRSWPFYPVPSDDEIRHHLDFCDHEGIALPLSGETVPIEHVLAAFRQPPPNVIGHWMDNELADFSTVIDHCSRIYSWASGGKISKPMTLPEEVIAEGEDRETREIEEAIAEDRREREVADTGPLSPMPLPTAAVLYAVAAERERQDAKWGRAAGLWKDSDGVKVAVLGEEFGEVCRALLENEGAARLRAELIQVAAVAVAWSETLS